MPGQPLVGKRVIGSQEFQRRPVLAEDVLKDQLGFAAHVGRELRVEFGKRSRIGRGQFQIAQPEPLAGEILDKRRILGVAEHPPHLGMQLGSQQAAEHSPSDGSIVTSMPDRA